MNVEMHGVQLVDRVIEQVTRHGWDTIDAPTLTSPVPVAPEVIGRLRIGGKPLPPSLQRWLAFDGSWLAELGWFENAEHPLLDGEMLGAVTTQMYGFTEQDDAWVEMFASFEVLLPERCFPLVGGSDSRRLLYAGKPDSTGEYPVLVTDIDDLPYVAVMYPGFDGYLADLAGVINLEFDEYTSLTDHPEYGSRMREHANYTGLGPEGKEIQDLDWPDAEACSEDAGSQLL
ncbi:hypothetical protein ACFV30_37620 [Streptomyces sp. NPDC059752]|uniref:hypothetical protein n=1 Tax=unclassified Streptomyces TaxID=2593676 RepID=UPI003654CB4A